MAAHTTHHALRITHHVSRVTYHVLLPSLPAFLLFFISACSLAEDVTPPPGLSLTQTAAAPTPAGPVLPRAVPNAAAGRLIFAQHCAECHGGAGRGDGPLAGQVNGQLPDFSSPAVTQARTPQELFTAITNGRLEKTMPPFGDALSATQRWNVTAYLYTLSAAPAAIEHGRALFAEACATCHGAAGRGDGPQAGGPLPDFTAPGFFALNSEVKFFEALTNGAVPEGHIFADTLGEDERWALATFVRALGYVQNEPAATAPGHLAVHGPITNGTAGAEAPAGLPVVLHVIEGFQEIGVYTATATGGQYIFADVPFAAEQVALVTAEYQGVNYTSQVIRLTESDSVIDLPLEVFETTTDPGAIRIQSWHIFFELRQPGAAQVGELMVFANDGDRTFAAPAEGGATLQIPLPAGAENLQFDDGVLGERYRLTPEGFAHSLAVPPGPQALRILFSFNLPLTGPLDFAQTTRYPVTSLNVFAPEGVLRLTSRQLSGPVPQDVEGTRYTSYASTGDLPAGSALALTVAPAGAGANLGLLAALGGLLALAGAWWLLARRPPASAPGADLGALIESLAQLDERYERGEYKEPDYRRQRARLKAHALKLMKED